MRPHVVHWLDGWLPSGAGQLIAPTWFTCVGLAGVLGLFALAAIARRDRIERRVVASIVLWCYLAAVIAGIVVPMAIDLVEQLVATGHLRVRWAGMTSFWGYLAGFCAVIAVCRANRIPLGRLGDLAAAPMGLALFCARIGCFLAGCDYGKVTSVPWAVRFPAGSPAWTDQLHAGLLPPERAESLPVHPTQLYEAALGLAMVALALALLRAQRSLKRMTWLRECNGRVFLVCAALYAIGRLAIESVRGDLGRGIYLGLSSGQIFSIIVLAVVSATWLATRRRAALIAVAATALVLAIVEPHEASAQPAPPPPPSQQPAPPEPQQPYPVPQQPYPVPQYPAPPAVQASAPAASSSPPIAIGALVGIAVPINRRADQVPALAGVSISGGYNLGPVGVWLDFDDYMSNEAFHRSGLVSASVTRDFGKWTFGARFGLGFTSVTFKDTAFAGATGSLVRVEGLAEYRFSSSWNAWARLTPFDLVTAADLGGSILTYQLRLGIAYRFGRGSAPAPAPPPPPLPPLPPAPAPGSQP